MGVHVSHGARRSQEREGVGWHSLPGLWALHLSSEGLGALRGDVERGHPQWD